MLARPLVTIGIPVKNGSNYLEEAIYSALAQSYKPIEIIVVDDGSDDHGKTWNIIQRFGNKVIGIQQKNKGTAGALNTCISYMNGEYFSWLSHDDLYSPVKIATQIEYVLANSFYNGILFSEFAQIDTFGTYQKSIHLKPEYLTHIFYTILSTSLHGCSLLIPKKIFSSVGLFNEKLITVCDNDLWFRMAFAGIPFYFQPYELVYSREHSMRASYTMYDIHRKEKELFFINTVKKLLPYLQQLNISTLLNILSSKDGTEYAIELIKNFQQTSLGN